MQSVMNRIGTGLSNLDATRARAAVSDPGLANGVLSYAKPGQQYSGPVVFVTDTHMVQRVSRNAAVAHDLGRLRNGPEVGQAYEALKPDHAAPRWLVRYDSDRGQAEVSPLKTAEAQEVKRLAQLWAERNISQPAARAEFGRRIDEFVSDLTSKQNLPALNAPTTRFARSLAVDQVSYSSDPKDALARIEGRAQRFSELIRELGHRDGVRQGAVSVDKGRDLVQYAPDPLVAASASAWARLDVADYRRLRSDSERYSAAVAMDNKSQRYQEALRVAGPDITSELRHYQIREMQLVLAKEERKRDELTQSPPLGARAPQQRSIER